jgi:hypothetical protein
VRYQKLTADFQNDLAASGLKAAEGALHHRVKPTPPPLTKRRRRHPFLDPVKLRPYRAEEVSHHQQGRIAPRRPSTMTDHSTPSNAVGAIIAGSIAEEAKERAAEIACIRKVLNAIERRIDAFRDKIRDELIKIETRLGEVEASASVEIEDPFENGRHHG